ncbi:MAG: peroxiredoxin-like family protein, partial [Acidobacteriota bacterium]
MKKVSIDLFGIFVFVLFASAVGVQAQAVSPEEAVKTALTVGATMPSFTLKDATGNDVRSDVLLKESNLVVVFYRGSWCPFCNTYLHTLQGRLADINAAGGKLVAISVENPDASMAVAKKNELQYTVLSD